MVLKRELIRLIISHYDLIKPDHWSLILDSSDNNQKLLSIFDKGLNQESLSKTAYAKKLLRKAIKQYKHRHFHLAFKATNKVIDSYPYIPRAWTLRGELKQILFEDWLGSENDNIEAIILNPNNLYSYFKLFSLSK